MCLPTCLQSIVWQRHTVFIDGYSTKIVALDRYLRIRCGRYGELEHTQSLLDNFWPNTVTWEDCDFKSAQKSDEKSACRKLAAVARSYCFGDMMMVDCTLSEVEASADEEMVRNQQTITTQPPLRRLRLRLRTRKHLPTAHRSDLHARTTVLS